MVLNRVVRWTDEGIQYEADPRQVERLVADCGLEQSRSVATPGVKASFQELEEDKELEVGLHSAFRGAAARGNYVSQDRVDAQLACKEVCRWMSKPSVRSWQALKRLCRYLAGKPRLIYCFPRQEVGSIDVYTDTDWAGCPRTRKSTSGGCVMFGSHAAKHWSSTQPSVSLSSGEAEYLGVVRGAGQGLRYQALLRDLGIDLPLRVWTDSSAAMGICGRQGLGKLRHLDTHTLWVQQAVRTGRFELRKVAGEENPADLLTKHSLSEERLRKLVELHGCRFAGGRAAAAPQLRRSQGVKVTLAGAGLDDGEALAMLSQGELGPSPHTSQGETEADPCMPHLSMGEEDMDRLHPKLVVTNAVELMEPDLDREDTTYQEGLRIAEEIRQTTRVFGRTRHEAASRPTAGPTPSLAGDKPGSRPSDWQQVPLPGRRPETNTASIIWR